MASVRSITFTLGIALAASNALAQTPAPELTAAQTDVACAPAPFLGVSPIDAPLVSGNQDTVTRSLVGDINPLVINAGTDRGVQFNQRYFVRRIYRNADDVRSKEPHLVMTTGWLHITAVNRTMSLAVVDHTCSHILEGDFLEAFHAPTVPADISDPGDDGRARLQSLRTRALRAIRAVDRRHGRVHAHRPRRRQERDGRQPFRDLSRSRGHRPAPDAHRRGDRRVGGAEDVGRAYHSSP